jgi:D-serine deaminase-like pyridoxal phosphate-dependent protein
MEPGEMAILEDIPTPALVLDRDKLLGNIEQMAARADQLGVTLRPHVKTPKSIDVMRCLPQRHAASITVSTLLEADYFLRHGIADIFYAVPFAPDKMPFVGDLRRRGAEIKLLVDSNDAARATAAAAAREACRVAVVVELDVDHYRTGVERGDPDFLRACQTLKDSTHTEFAGIMSYGGASYLCSSETEIADLTEAHRLAAIGALDTLGDAGLSAPIVSFGSSPATFFAHRLDGFTEARCGIFLFQDLFQTGLGTCTLEDIAISVLTTVVGRNEKQNRVIVDAGGLALSKDRSTAQSKRDAGYGLVCDGDGTVLPDLFVAAVSQELGLVTTFSGRPIDLSRFPIGRKLRILPNHADMTAAAYDTYHVVRGSPEVVDRWTRVNGWFPAHAPSRKRGA